MKLLQFEIVFDGGNEIFYAGDHLKGSVIINLVHQSEVQGIYIDIVGEGHCQWTYGIGDDEKLFGNDESYLGTRILYFGHTTDEDSLIYHPAGRSEYRFNVLIPASAPSSFASSRGTVRYICTAKIDRGWKGCFEEEKEFIVIHHLDLSRMTNVGYTVSAEEEETVESCCTESGTCYVNVKMPKKGYVPGEIVPVTMEINNKSTQNVTRNSLTLCQTITYYGYKDSNPANGEKVSYSKHKYFQLFEDESCILKKQRGKTLSFSVTLPPEPPSKLEGCSLLDINYEFIFQVTCGLSEIEIATEVIIGTLEVQGMGTPNDSPAPITMPLPMVHRVPHLQPTAPSLPPAPAATPAPRSEDPPAYEEVILSHPEPPPYAVLKKSPLQDLEHV